MVPRRRRRHSRQQHDRHDHHYPSPPHLLEEKKSADSNNTGCSPSEEPQKEQPPNNPPRRNLNSRGNIFSARVEFDSAYGKRNYSGYEEEPKDENDDDDECDDETEEMIRLQARLTEVRRRKGLLEERLHHAEIDGTCDIKKERRGVFAVSKDVSVLQGTSHPPSQAASGSSLRMRLLQRYSQRPYIHPLDKVRLEHMCHPLPTSQQQQQSARGRKYNDTPRSEKADTGRDTSRNVDLVALSRSLTGISMEWITSTVDPPIPILPMQSPHYSHDAVWKLQPSSPPSSSTTKREEREQVLRVQFHVAMPTATTRKLPHYALFFDMVERKPTATTSSSSSSSSNDITIQQPPKRKRQQMASQQKENGDALDSEQSSRRRTYLRCVQHTLPSQGAFLDVILSRHGFDAHRMLELDQWTKSQQDEEGKEKEETESGEHQYEDGKEGKGIEGDGHPSLRQECASSSQGGQQPLQETDAKRAPPLAWNATSATGVLNHLRRCVVDLYNACCCYEQRQAACRRLASQQEQTEKFLSHLVLVAKGDHSNNPHRPTVFFEAMDKKEPIVLLQNVSYDDAYIRIAFDVTTTVTPPTTTAATLSEIAPEAAPHARAVSSRLLNYHNHHPHIDSSTSLIPPTRVELEYNEPLLNRPTEIYSTRTTNCTPEAWGGVKVGSLPDDYNDDVNEAHQSMATIQDLFRGQSIPQALPTLCDMLVQEWQRKERLA